MAKACARLCELRPAHIGSCLPVGTRGNSSLLVPRYVSVRNLFLELEPPIGIHTDDLRITRGTRPCNTRAGCTDSTGKWHRWHGWHWRRWDYPATRSTNRSTPYGLASPHPATVRNICERPYPRPRRLCLRGLQNVLRTWTCARTMSAPTSTAKAAPSVPCCSTTVVSRPSQGLRGPVRVHLRPAVTRPASTAGTAIRAGGGQPSSPSHQSNALAGRLTICCP
jgi:hypothetical protein